MPKSWRDNTLQDWLHLRPFITRYKHARFLFAYGVIVRQQARSGDAHAIIEAIKNKQILVTIAFNAPAKVALQIRAVRQFVSGSIHIIADNSSDDELAAAIQRIAAEEGALYIRLPPAPWTGADAGLSHGLGMTWVWRNIIRRGEPYAFGFLDHDIYPTAPDDPFESLKHYPIAGRVWLRPPRWQLWAGFCFYRFDFVKNLKLCFVRDYFAGLDTGGGNWGPLYRKLDPLKVADPGIRYEAILLDTGADECRVEWLGSWIHEHNDWRFLHGSLQRDFMAEKAGMVSKKLEAILSRSAGG